MAYVEVPTELGVRDDHGMLNLRIAAQLLERRGLTVRDLMLLVEDVTQGAYASWTAGLTDRPDERRQEHGDPPHWQCWPTASKEDGEAAERHYVHDKGMKGGCGGRSEGSFFYIF